MTSLVIDVVHPESILVRRVSNTEIRTSYPIAPGWSYSGDLRVMAFRDSFNSFVQ